MSKVKVCGMTERKNLKEIVKKPIDAVGFILAASRRQVSLKKAEKLVAELPPFVSSVGVVQNPDLAGLREIETAGLFDFIQFHGQEPPDMLNEISFRTIKAISVSKPEDLNQVQKYSAADYFLFDSRVGARRGGTGKKFDWSYLDSFSRDNPFILAGGLGPENIAEAIRQVEPAAVDLNSKIEVKPGLKDPEKLEDTLAKKKGVKDQGG